jgi:D-3-phosphoglycerate dehydrogenase
MEEPKVLLTAPIHSAGVEVLSRVAEVVTAPKRLSSEEELAAAIRDFDAVVSMGVEPFTKKVLESTTKLLIVARHGVGYDNIDVESATKLGIWVTITPVEELFEAVADHAMALLLCLIRRVCDADEFVRSGNWFDNPFENRVFVGMGLRGKVMGIIGLGRIGSRIAERAKGFGLKVVYYDIERKVELEKKLGAEFCSLDELLKRSDIIIIAVSLTEKTRGLIGRREISLMKSSAVLVNIARGPVVDYEALVEALESGRIAGAALDVFHREPLEPNNRLTKLKNTILTPHIAWLTEEARRAMAVAVAEEILRVLKGENPIHPVNLSVRENARNRRRSVTQP